MRIVVDTHVPGAINCKARKMRRLVYLAWIARDMGHDVAVRCDPEEIQRLRPKVAYKNTSRFDFLDILGLFPKIEKYDCDLLICSEETALGQRAKPSCKVLAWRTMIGGGHKPIAWRGKFDLLAGYILTQRDFTKKTHYGGGERGDVPTESPLGNKWLSVPWLPFEAVQHELYRAGLWEHYLRDELEPIRERYAAEKIRFAGFRGYNWPQRSRISAAFKGDDRFVFDWADSQAVSMPAADYLRWIAGCRIVMALPGDTWKTSRFAEAVMLGVPVAITLRMFPEIIPMPTPENCLLLGEWTPSELLAACDTDQDGEIRFVADKAYRDGWSLRGQFIQALKRLNL